MDLQTLRTKIGQRFEYKKSLAEWFQQQGYEYTSVDKMVKTGPSMDFETKRWAYETFKSALVGDSSPEAVRLLRYVNRAVGIEGDSDYQFDVASYRLASYLVNSGTDYPPYNCETNVNTSGVQNFGSLSGGLNGWSPHLIYTGGSTVLAQASNSHQGDVVGGAGEGGQFYAERDSAGRITYLEVYSGNGYQSGDIITIPSSLINDVVDIVINLSYANGMDIIGAWQNCNSLTSFPLLDVSSGTNFGVAWYNCNSLTSFPLLDVSSGTTFSSAWGNCNSLTSFPLLDVSSGTNFDGAWYSCNSLTSFPLLDVSSGTTFISAWNNCTGLTSFPLIDVSNGTNFFYSWHGCNSLTSFPLLDVSSGTNFDGAWSGCNSLTSFPLLDVSSGTNFGVAWYNCNSLTSFPAGMFDTCTATNFGGAWQYCALDQTSVDNILVSLDTAGQSNGTVNINGGTSAAPSATGLAAKASLIAKGWTVYTN
jgi:hypothetical protein